MTVCVRAGFDKVLPAQAMECADKTGRHGMVHGPNRSPWRVRNRLHAGSGRFPCPVWRLETPTASACSIQGGNTTGVTHEAAKRWVPERSKTRIRRTGCGVEQFPCRRRARQHPISCAGWGSSPTQQWEEFPESPRAALAPVRRGDGGNSRPTGCGNGLRHPSENGCPRRIMRRGVRVAPGALPSDTGDRGGPGRCVPSHPRGGRASPSHHDRQPWCDAGPGAPGPPRTIRMDGGIRRFGDARPTARWCNGSTPAPVAGGPGSNPEAGADAHTIRSPTIP